MRIAVLTSSYPEWPGDPAGHFVATEVAELERAGHVVTVIALRGAAFGWPGVIARLRERPLRATSIVTAWRAAQAALHAGPQWDRVVAHWMPLALLARDVHAPLEVVAHGSDVRLVASLPAPLRPLVARRLVDRAERVRFVSTALADAFAEYMFRSDARELRARQVIAPAPIAVSEVRAESKRLRAGIADRRIVVTVGRLVPSKEVARVVEHVADERATTTLVVVGDGPERESLARLARTLNVDARFVGLVERDRALAWIGAADAVYHASRAEGVSTVLREAEILGTPVVSL